jgi:hypothetical protein
MPSLRKSKEVHSQSGRKATMVLDVFMTPGPRMGEDGKMFIVPGDQVHEGRKGHWYKRARVVEDAQVVGKSVTKRVKFRIAKQKFLLSFKRWIDGFKF